MSAHTPGPWSAEKYLLDDDEPNGGSVCEINCIVGCVAKIVHGNEADARLIAAAPELLEALKGEATVIDGKLCWCGRPNMIPYRGHDSGCEYNRELVAKAEGES